MNRKEEGIFLYCDNSGRIIEVLFNSLAIGSDKIVNHLFIDFVRVENISHALDFFTGIKKGSAAFGYELFLRPDISQEVFYFSGALINGNILIFGSERRLDLNKFLNGMMLINNEQVNRIRSLEKERRIASTDGKEINFRLFDELSRLNNELVDMQRELTKKNIELAELNKLKNQFIGMAAHDLRNPLGNIINFAEFLREEDDTFNDEQKEFLENIKSQSSFMLRLVNELLDISVIESGNVNLNFSETDIVLLVQQVVHLDKALAEKKDMKIELHTEPVGFSISIDEQKIRQVITNLLTNAIKFSHPGSLISIDLKINEGQIIVSVKDEGQGIHPEEMEKLFKPFHKTNTKSTGGEKSTGLGLFISKQIVNAHGGKIWAESKLEEGSAFYFSLPLKLN